MSKKLEEIRKKIDALDNKIHDVLMERAALIVDVAAEKKKKKLPFVQPAREAEMIRRLLARHKGALPAAAVVRIWRELVGAVSLMQAGLKVSVTHEEGRELLWDMAKSYFGSVVPMQRASSPLVALASVREDEASFAVLPWPHDGEENPWWTYLFNQENNQIGVVCALPYGSGEGETLSWEDKGLIVSKTEYAESGEDHSFILISMDRSASRGGIVDALKALGFEPLSLFTDVREGQAMHLVEVNDYMSADDERLAALAQKFEEQNAACISIGGYPVPPVYKKSKAEKQANSIPTAPKKKTGT